MKIPLARPDIDMREVKAVERVLQSGWLAHGEETELFEREFARYIGADHAIAVNSCAAALQLSLQACGMRGEVIVPSFTFVASINAIVNAGCRPRFADIEYHSANIDPLKIERLITERTVAIMPVHFAGQSCDMGKISEIARRYNLQVIEDSAEAIGSEWSGKRTGSFGIGCFSFFATKNMTCGEGGMVTVRDQKLKEKIAAYANHGISKEVRTKPRWQREADVIGYNFRMSDIMAAIGRIQLKKLDRMNERRRQHARYLDQKLKNVAEVEVPFCAPEAQHAYQMYTIRVKTESIDRDAFVSDLNKKGIGASVHFYPAVHQQALYKSFLLDDEKLPVTEEVSKRIISLPFYPQLSAEDLDCIVRSVKDAITRTRR